MLLKPVGKLTGAEVRFRFRLGMTPETLHGHVKLLFGVAKDVDLLFFDGTTNVVLEELVRAAEDVPQLGAVTDAWVCFSTDGGFLAMEVGVNASANVPPQGKQRSKASTSSSGSDSNEVDKGARGLTAQLGREF